jgi:hypothetical protein
VWTNCTETATIEHLTPSGTVPWAPAPAPPHPTSLLPCLAATHLQLHPLRGVAGRRVAKLQLHCLACRDGAAGGADAQSIRLRLPAQRVPHINRHAAGQLHCPADGVTQCHSAQVHPLWEGGLVGQRVGMNGQHQVARLDST